MQARVSLTEEDWQGMKAALADALEGLVDMRPYVPDFSAERWDHDGYIRRARLAVAMYLEDPGT